MRIKKIKTDGGRQGAGFEHESNDCTVRALSIAAQIDYATAHKIMEEEGRKPGQGGYCFAGIMNAQDKGLLTYSHVDLPRYQRTYNRAPGWVGANGRPIRVIRFGGPNVKQFIETHCEGRYMVCINKHVFALIDGVIYDRFAQHAGAIVKAAYKIELRSV